MTDKKTEALKLALGALELYLKMDTVDESYLLEIDLAPKAITAIKQALTEQPAQQQEPDNTDDPLQGAVDWLLQADGEYFCTATVQRTLRIGYNRAKRLCDTAKERAAHGIKGDA